MPLAVLRSISQGNLETGTTSWTSSLAGGAGTGLTTVQGLEERERELPSSDAELDQRLPFSTSV